MSTVIKETVENVPSGDTVTPLPEKEAYTKRYQRAQERVRAIRGFFEHLTVYVVINLFLFAINMLTGSHSLWFYWPLLGWGSAVVIHALVTFGPASKLGPAWEERKIKEYMENDQL
jgi:2TM domain